MIDFAKDGAGARAFDSAKRVLCCISKDSDIPEVEAVIRLLLPSLDAFWQKLVAEAVVLVEAELDSFDDKLNTPSIDAITLADRRERDKLTEDLILALFLIIDQRARQPITDSGTALLTRAVSSLLEDGAKSVGEKLDLTRSPLLPQAAIQDLMTLIRGRIELRRVEIQHLLRVFLTQRTARNKDGTTLEEAARENKSASSSFAAWKAALLLELGALTASWLPSVVDQWAYRWFNIGAFSAARQGGAIGIRAVAVLDHKTSPFCRWVNGRIISIERAQRQVDRHVQLALAGDVAGLMANWPMLQFRAADGPAEFAVMFERVGLPPYHFRCRTRPELVRFR